jgi:DNA repair ATPase RecN
MDNTTKALQELETLLEFVSESINMIQDHNEDNSHQTSVHLAKRAYKIKEMYEKYKTVATALNSVYARLVYTDIPHLMEAEGIDSQRIIGVGKVSLKTNRKVKVLDESALHQFMISNGYESIIKTHSKIHPQTLKACINNNFQDVEVEGVQVTTQSEAVFSKNG